MPHGLKEWASFIAAQAVLTFAWHWTAKLAEHAMLTWSDDQIASFLGFSAPQASTVISWAIPTFLGAATLFIYHLVRIRAFRSAIAVNAPVAVSGTVPDTAALAASAPLSIELGLAKDYERIEHFAINGLLRRTIAITITNRSADDISDCNLKLIAATPPAMIGDSKALYPILFTQNFDLYAGKMKRVEIISLVENGWQTGEQRDSIRIHAASVGWQGGWTTLSPIPPQNNPAILTFEAFATGTASSQTRIKVWVDETMGRKLRVAIA